MPTNVRARDSPRRRSLSCFRSPARSSRISGRCGPPEHFPEKRMPVFRRKCDRPKTLRPPMGGCAGTCRARRSEARLRGVMARRHRYMIASARQTAMHVEDLGMTYDLILRGGRVVDPSQKLDAVTDVGLSAGK